MWIDQLDIGGFKRLRGLFAFERGLNLVIGDNEAGKTTLHDALVRGLFGFSKREQHGGDNSLRGRCRPWLSELPYELTMLVRDARDGRSYRIEWDFGPHVAKVLDADTGKDVSSQVAVRDKEVRLGKFLLDEGFGVNDFRDVCCLEQVAVKGVGRSDWLANALQQAVASVSSDVRVQEADGMLKSFLSELGYHATHYTPTATGSARRRRGEADRLKPQLEACRAGRERIAGLAAELREREGEQADLEASREQLHQRLLLTEARELEARLGEARRQEEIARQKPGDEPGPSQAAVDAIRGRQQALELLRRPITELEAAVERARERMTDLGDRRRELVGRIDGLEPYAGVDGSMESTLREDWGALQVLPTDAAAPDGSSELLPPAAAGSRLRKILWKTLLVLTVGIAYLVSRLLRFLRARMAARAVAEAVAREREQSARRRGELELRLTGALDQVGVPAEPELERRVRAYLTACEGKQERLRLEVDLAQLNVELDHLKEPARGLEARLIEREGHEQGLRSLYEQLGIAATDLDAAGAVLSKQVEAAEAVREQAQEAAAAGQALSSLLAGGTIADLQHRCDDAAHRLREHVATYGELATDPGDSGQLGRDLVTVDDELRNARDRIQYLAGQIEAGERELADPVELEERLGEAEVALERLELARDATRIAREALSKAAEEAHREFAPHLRGALGRSLPRITNGRYREALVDDNLVITVRAPETNSFVPVSELSRATQDQIYLVQRLEIARLLDPTMGAAPLLLDDPFAHFDPTRLRLGLELLSEVARDRQVVIFSEEPELAELTREACGAVRVIRLESPGAGQGAA